MLKVHIHFGDFLEVTVHSFEANNKVISQHGKAFYRMWFKHTVKTVCTFIVLLTQSELLS